VLQHHRLDMFDAVIEKVALPVDDALNDAVDSLPAVLDGAQQIDGRADLFFDKVLCLLGGFVLIEELMIRWADSQPRATVVGEIDDVFLFDLLDVNFRGDKNSLVRRISAARIWVK